MLTLFNFKIYEVKLLTDNKQYSLDVMYWIGYTYRFWHYYKKEKSKNIYKIADAKRMAECYLAFHTMDVKMAIDNLYEIYNQHKNVK